MLAAADPALMSLVGVVVVTAGGIAVGIIARADRARLDRLEDAVRDCERRDRRKHRALLRLGVDPDDAIFDDDDG